VSDNIKIFLITCACIVAFLYLPSNAKSGAKPIPPENWNSETPVQELLFTLTGSRSQHYIENLTEDQILAGETLVRNGRLKGSKGASTPRISHYFQCPDCHNAVREDAVLTDISNPAAKLGYTVGNDIPLLQGSTFAGTVNRESWYNDDYARKYRFSPLVQLAPKSLTKAI